MKSNFGGEKPCFIPIDEEDVIEMGVSLPFAKGRWNLALGGSGNQTTAKEDYRSIGKP